MPSEGAVQDIDDRGQHRPARGPYHRGRRPPPVPGTTVLRARQPHPRLVTAVTTNTTNSLTGLTGLTDPE